MLIGAYYNPFLSPKRLDRFLAHGWFRSCNILGKQKLICLNEGIYPIINIRVQLEGYKYPKKLQKIMNRNLGKFRYEINSVKLNARKEALYQAQKSRFIGLIMPTLSDALFGEDYQQDYMRNPFHTQEICVYDQDELVAVSFFDVGYQSVASILGLFDERYSKFSLGIYTMLLEISLGQRLGKKFYYPGYILHKDHTFDYKLRLGNLQYHNGENYWRPFGEVNQEVWLDRIIADKTAEIAALLQQNNVSCKTLWNPYFPFAYIFADEIMFLASPMQVFCANNFEHQPLVLEYMPDTKHYRLSYVQEAEPNEELNEMLALYGTYQTEIYSQKVYVYKETIYESFDLAEMVGKVLIEKILLRGQS